MDMISTQDIDKIIGDIVKQDAEVPASDKRLGYGTAGFRTLGSQLEKCCFRVGILVAMRAKLTTLAGVMITASHNPSQDNGVKIIEGDGSMLQQEWESLAENLINAEDIEKYLREFDQPENRIKYGF